MMTGGYAGISKPGFFLVHTELPFLRAPKLTCLSILKELGDQLTMRERIGLITKCEYLVLWVHQCPSQMLFVWVGNKEFPHPYVVVLDYWKRRMRRQQLVPGFMSSWGELHCSWWAWWFGDSCDNWFYEGEWIFITN